MACITTAPCRVTTAAAAAAVSLSQRRCLARQPTTASPSHRSHRAVRRCQPLTEAKMHVPTDSFGGMDAEHFVSNILKKLSINASVEVMHLLELVEATDVTEEDRHADSMRLKQYLEAHPLKNADDWLNELFTSADGDIKESALRLLSVCERFADESFNYQKMKDHTLAGLKEDSALLMQEYMEASFNMGSEVSVSGDGDDADTPLQD